MPIYQAIVLAIVQGLTEFLPVSSTAHLVLFPWFAHWTDPGLTFDVALHAGTLIAVFFFFWRRWMEMLGAAAGIGDKADPKVQENRRLFWYLVIATIPGGIAGYLLEKQADAEFRTPVVIGVALVVVALFMWAGERMGKRDESLGQVTLSDAVWIGIAQAFAVVPGVSRSGATMTAGLFRGMDRESDARFSFLLSTPIIAGAALKKGLEIRHEGLPHEMRAPMLVGILISAVVGYIVIGWLIRYLATRTFTLFVIYRLALGALVLIFARGHAIGTMGPVGPEAFAGFCLFASLL
ncbi:MAG TPA: undecaprenyl-diphosphatase UppP [Terriglobia bacterium]|nr:undecaprenyl-diphosphatase UppP [Terriglobia bacterium]